ADVCSSDLSKPILEAGLENRFRPVTQLRATGDETLERLGVEEVIRGEHPVVGVSSGALDDRLVGGRQGVPLPKVDVERQIGLALPPARSVVVLDYLVEAELLVVVGADPLGGVDCALLECRIDVGAAQLLWYHYE